MPTALGITLHKIFKSDLWDILQLVVSYTV